MSRLVLLLIYSPWIVRGVLYIDRHALEFDVNVVNASTSYFRDENGNSLSNFAFETFKTVTKALLYFNVRLAKDKSIESTGLNSSRL